MEIKMYANYGIKGYKFPVFHTAKTEISDPVTVVIPSEWETYLNDANETIIVLPDGTKCLENEIQTAPNRGAYYCGNKNTRYYVEVKYEV